MNDSEIEAFLNLPAMGAGQVDNGTFQLVMEPDASMIAEEVEYTTPKDQIVSGIKAMEQLAFITSIYYKGKYGVPMLPVIPKPNSSLANFHLENE